MTRLYSSEFPCEVCYRVSSLGWLYRCTQDRELLIEEDFETDDEVGMPAGECPWTLTIDRSQEKLDQICDLFPRPSSPRKNSPAARMPKLSFLEEVSDADLKSYTPAQLAKILSQRAHASHSY